MNTPLFPNVASEFDLRGQVAKEFFANFHTIIENNRVDFVVSTDKHFNELDGKLRATLKALAVQIQPKVYEYGFLKD